MADLIHGPAAPGPIRIPEWQDVIHIRPRARLTETDRLAWRVYLREKNLMQTPVADLRARLTGAELAGLTAAGVTPAKLDQLLRGRQIYQDMRASAIPQWRRELLRVVTHLDDIQDQIATIAWITDPITRRWAPTRVVSEILHRSGDVINLMERIVAGVPRGRYAGKSKADREAARSARRARGKIGMFGGAVKWLQKSQGHLIEAGQALDTWTGVGISLGSIIGAMEETADRAFISAYEAAKFTVAGAGRLIATPGGDLDQILHAQQHASVQRLRETGAPLAAQMQGWIFTALKAASPLGILATVAAAAARLQRDNDTYTRAEHALALYHSATINPLLGQILTAITDPRALARIPELEPAPPRILDGYGRDLLIEAGADLTEDGAGAGLWQEPHTTLQAHIEQLIEDSTQARATWLPQNVATEEDQFMHALLEANREGASWLIGGSADALHVIPDPEQRALMYALHLEEMPPAGTTHDQLVAWMADQVESIDAAPDEYTERLWRDVTARHWPISSLGSTA